MAKITEHIELSDDEKTVRSHGWEYKFHPSPFTKYKWFNSCGRCALKLECTSLSVGKIDFPFPCTSDSRKDKKAGYYRESRFNKLNRKSKEIFGKISHDHIKGFIVGIGVMALVSILAVLVIF